MPPPRAEFLTSVPVGGEIPAAGLPVVALVGRSNVGKSSLVNALSRRRIARVGAKPGTTRLINVYRLSTTIPRPRAIIIADLPGYGYARGGTRTRREFQELTRGFFDKVVVEPPLKTPAAAADPAIREGSGTQDGAFWLAAVVLVVDIRHPGLDSDIAAHRWATDNRYPLLTVATKGDRVSRSARERARRDHAGALGGGSVLVVSAQSRVGIPELWAQLRALL